MIAPVHTIRVDRAGTKIIGGGTPATTWAPLVTLRAAITAETAAEKQTDRGAASEASITFRVRYFPDLVLGDRIAFRGRAWNIIEILPVGRDRYLDLTATSLEP